VLSISVVRAALATQVGNLAFPALRSLPKAEDQINPPVGIVMPARQYGKYGITLQGATGFLGVPSLGNTLSPTEISLDYFILLSKASTLERIEENLDLWIGFESDGTAVSVPAAIEADPTLGGVVEWCHPMTVDAPGPVEWEGIQFFGTRIQCSLSVG
jgi:hypothetical protein